MAERAKIDKHMNLYEGDIEDFEEMYGVEHGIFSRLTREMFHNFVQKSKHELKKEKKKKGGRG